MLSATLHPGGSWVDRLKSPRFWAFAVAAAALAVLILFWAPNYWVGVAAAVALPILFARHPAALVVFMFSIAQEVVPRPQVGAVTTLGHQSFYAGRVPLILILAVTAALLSVVRIWPIRSRDISVAAKVVLTIVAALVLLSVVAGFIAGQSLLSAINQNARPFAACGVGFVIGLSLRALPGEERLAEYASGVAIVGLAIAAAYAAAMGMPADGRVSRYFIYYDSALPALAAAVFLALLCTQWRRDWRRILIMAACLIIVVVSFRRGVWIAAAFALAATLLLTRRRGRSLGRLAIATAGLIAMLVVVPGLAMDVHARLVGAPAAQQVVEPPVVAESGQSDPARAGATGGGSRTEAAPQKTEDFTPSVSGDVAANSSEGHRGDLRVGWHYVKQNFWTGIGPREKQLPGLAADKSQLVYVHNEWLMDWLRFGPLAPVLVTAFLGILAFMAVRILRRPESGTIQRSAAMFCLITPACLVLFPFLTTTTRWPLLLGISAGVLGLQKSVLGTRSSDNIDRTSLHVEVTNSGSRNGSSHSSWERR